jgi:hypothetical protein
LQRQQFECIIAAAQRKASSPLPHVLRFALENGQEVVQEKEKKKQSEG